MLVEIDAMNESLNEYGDADHSSYNDADASGWWDDRNIRRSIFMGDLIRAVSAAGVSRTNPSTLEEMTVSSSHRVNDTLRPSGSALIPRTGTTRSDREDERSEGEDRSDAGGSQSEEDDDREPERSDDEERSGDTPG